VPRLFYGIEIPHILKSGLRAAQTELKRGTVSADGWSNPDLFHVTVLFMGVVADECVTTLGTIGTSVARTVDPFSLSIGAYEVFPRNKVLFVGIGSNKGGLRQLAALHEQLHNEVSAQLSIELEERAYKPHLTLARKVKQSHGVEKQHPSLPDTEFDVNALCLFESTRIDGQLVYPVRQRFPLGITQSGNDVVRNT